MKHFPKLLLAVAALVLSSAVLAQEDATCKEVKYNNESLVVDLGVGLWGIPIPTDYDGDGITDLLVSCPDRPYKGLYFFRNVGSLDKPLFAKAKLISSKGYNNIKLSVVDGEEYVLSAGKEWTDFNKRLYKAPKEITYTGEVLGATYKKSRSNMWSYVDWDEDGDKDILVGIDTWDDYGWDNAYNEKGEWTNGPLHGYVYLLENVDGEYVNQGKIEAGGAIIDTYGAPNPCIADFDNDGDLDIICGEFVDGLTWYENVGTRKEPRFAAARQIVDRKGKEVRFHIEMIVPVACDFNKDGFVDLVVGDEDGRIAYLRNTGKVKKNMPQWEAPYYFEQEADLVKYGALVTPWSVDWDGDGKMDLVCGNSAGELALVRNLTGGAQPSWAEPIPFTVKGKNFRLMAGDNGSIQGPAERKWGYTAPTVADWDGDGRMDIIINSITGKIQWLKGLGGMKLSAPKDVKVDFAGEPMPRVEWNWWTPEPNTLTTQWRTTPVPIDWTGDGVLDLVVLDTEGYLALYEGTKSKSGEIVVKPARRVFYCTNCSLYNNKKGAVDTAAGVLRLNDGVAGKSGRRKICFSDWDGDGRLDLIVDSKNAAWFRNVEQKDGNTWFEYMGNLASKVLEGHTVSPTVVDWNADGKEDILLGAEDGHFYLIENKLKYNPEEVPTPNEVVKLYPEGVPSSNGLEHMRERINSKGYILNITDPEILVFLPKEGKATGEAILVVPGGGYERNCITREGYKTAEWLNQNGIAAFVLKYRLPNGHPEIPLEDGEKAMRIIREGADKWGIDKNKVGVIGFSAGGHFASNLLTRYTSAETRPDFGVLIYPVISMQFTSAGTRENLLGDDKTPESRKLYSTQNSVHKGMPPVMMVLTSDDKAVDYENAVMFYSALLEKKVKNVEMHVFPSGGHGFWFQNRYKYANETYPMIIRWIRERCEK